MRFDQDAAIASAPPHEPDERAFRFVDGHIGAAEISDDLSLRQSKMLRAKAVNDRLGRLRLAGCCFPPLASPGLPAPRSRRLEVGGDCHRFSLGVFLGRFLGACSRGVFLGRVLGAFLTVFLAVLCRIIYLHQAPKMKSHPNAPAKLSTAFRNLFCTRRHTMPAHHAGTSSRHIKQAHRAGAPSALFRASPALLPQSHLLGEL
jgi:hypothetical protein